MLGWDVEMKDYRTPVLENRSSEKTARYSLTTSIDKVAYPGLSLAWSMRAPPQGYP